MSRWRRYRIILAALPYVVDHAFRKPYRRSAQARCSTAELDHPEFRRVVHDVYCAMFLRGYRESTGLRVDPATGLATVLFAVFMYVFDDEFERRHRRGEATDADTILNSPSVAMIWNALGSYLDTTGRDGSIRHYILTDFFGTGFDDYRDAVADAEAGGPFTAAMCVVAFDSGEVLHTAYQVIRLFNGHPYHERCAQQFRNLGLAGKFLDDIADFSQDVGDSCPNLLNSFVTERAEGLAEVRAALNAGKPLTMRWWREHCPIIYLEYLRHIDRYYGAVVAPHLRLPLDIFLMLLHSRRFWTVSTVRTPYSDDPD
ncbi:hypothetical protein [Nocardia sp. CA-119907]|uniref:hypothetical protein n=1 Tax=Nocardia sp. CA-119907 TaxID=3239973 RepID=UPI003D97A8A5